LAAAAGSFDAHTFLAIEIQDPKPSIAGLAQNKQRVEREWTYGEIFLSQKKSIRHKNEILLL
jgi:hypothetical protein